MLRGVVVTGLAGLGLIGGTAAVKHNDNGSSTVKVSNGGVTRTVNLPTAKGGQQYSCPADINSKLSPIDKTSGRIKLTEQDVASQMHEIEAQYPQHAAPPATARQYNDLLRRDKELIQAFNVSINQHNAVITEECTKG